MGKATASFSSATNTWQDPLCISDIVSRGGIMASGAGALLRGAVVEYQIANDKWHYPATVANGILAEDCDATAADASCVVYVGGIFMASGIIWPAGPHDTVTEQLRAAGIQLESVEVYTGAMVKPAILASEKLRPDDTAITKDPKSKTILTDHGPVPRESEPGATPTVSHDAHPSELRVQPGHTEPPKPDDNDTTPKPPTPAPKKGQGD